MSQRLSKEQIIERFQPKLVDALEGSAEIQEVCGLSIESFREDLVAERNRLMKQCDQNGLLTTGPQKSASDRA